MAKRDYYDVLGASRNASESDIRTAYRKLARKFHPDVNKAPDSAQKFREATEAYEVLSDAQKRRMYDEYGHAGPVVQPPPPGANGGRYTWSPRGGGGMNFEDIFGGEHGFMGMSLDEILDSLGGGRAGRRGGRGAAPGAGRSRRPAPQDVEHHLTLEFVQAIYGTTVTLEIAWTNSSVR